MESERKSKGIIIGVLCAVIVFMSIGFAALSSQLTINGNATISDTWNVQIASITKKESSDGVNETSQPTFTATTANFNVSLKEPGDYAIYTVTVKNTVTKDNMDYLNTDEAIQPTLSFKAYAVQYDNIYDATKSEDENAAVAWVKAQTDGSN